MDEAQPEATRTRTRRTVLLALPWAAILVLTGAVQFYRGAVPDGVVFEVAAVLIVGDALGWLPEPAQGGRASFTLLLVVGAVAVVALILMPRHTPAEGVVVIAVGVLAIPLAWRGNAPIPSREGEPARRAIVRSAVAWGCVALATALWELGSFVLGRVDLAHPLDHPAISTLLDPVVDTWIGRLVFAILWVLAGIGLLTRARRQ